MLLTIYDSHNDYSDPNLDNLRSLRFRSAKTTSKNSSDFAGRISRGKFTYYEEKVTTIQVSESVNEELWVRAIAYQIIFPAFLKISFNEHSSILGFLMVTIVAAVLPCLATSLLHCLLQSP